MRSSQQLSTWVVYLCILAGIAIAARIDDLDVVNEYTEIQRSDPFDPRLFHTLYANGTINTGKPLAITLEECEKCVGSGMERYPTLDIQSRFATWIVPLFLLIVSMPFAPLGVGNTASVIIHVLADPISSFESQVSRLAHLQRRLKYCHSCLGQMPDNLKIAVAMTIVAHEESGPRSYQETREKLIAGGERRGRSQGYRIPSDTLTTKDRPALIDIFDNLLGKKSFPLDRKQQLQRVTFLEMANQLSDIRSSSLSKAVFGVVIYLLTITTAFIHIDTDDYKPHTDHSIAMAVLYSWLVPTVLLGALVGGFGKKQSAGDILARLYQKSSDIEARGCSEASDQEAPSIYLPQQHQAFSSPLRTCSSPSRFEPDLVLWLRLLELEIEHSDYSYLCWSGGNGTFRPRQGSWGKRKPWITAIAHFPVVCSVLCAFLISYISPTTGVGCRSLFQVLLGATWVVNACITEMIRNRTQSARKQWCYVRIKNAIIFLPQTIVFIAVFIGLFNSCLCWSAWFSLGSKAHVLLKSNNEVRRLSKTIFPALTAVAVISQLILLGCIWYRFRRGARLFHLTDEERYKIQPRAGG